MATSTTSRIEQDSLPQPTLSLAFELGQHTWKLGFTIGVAQQPRERTIPAGALEKLQQEIARAKQRFGLPENARVVSCYEAGRDGCWLHRSLVAHGVQNHVIDSASLEVNRANAGRRPIGSMSASSGRCCYATQQARRRCGVWYAYRAWTRKTAGSSTGN